MKSMIKRTIYASLGLLGDGTNAIKNLGKELARKANVSEVEGEKIARMLEAKSRTAVKSIRKTLDAEVTKVADAMHAAMDVRRKRPKPAPAVNPLSKKLGRTRRSRLAGKEV